MIRVTVELLPGGYAGEPVALGDAGFANMTPWWDPAQYIGVVRTPDRNRTVVVESHDRSRGVWALVLAMLQEAPAEALTPDQERHVAAIIDRLGFMPNID